MLAELKQMFGKAVELKKKSLDLPESFAEELEEL
jgi:hypothetical protein